MFHPLTAIQLLWLNLVTDGAPALALAMEKGDPDIMEQPPRPTKEHIINQEMWLGVAIQTVAITAVTLGAYYLGLYLDSAHIEFAETMAFVTLSLSELLRAYTARSEYYPLAKIGFFTNKWMNIAILSSAVLVLMVVYIPFFNTVFDTLPLGGSQWLVIVPLLAIPSITAEITKNILSNQRKKRFRSTARGIRKAFDNQNSLSKSRGNFSLIIKPEMVYPVVFRDYAQAAPG